MMLAFAIPLLLVCAEAPPSPPAFAPDRAAQIMALVESYQPVEVYLPNRWSMVERSAFLYAGTQKMFAAESGPIRALAAAQPEFNPDDFVLAALGELPSANASPEIAGEARRFLAILEREDLLIHLDVLGGSPNRLIAPAPYWGINAPLSAQETYEFGALRNMTIGACARMRIAADDKLGFKVAGRYASAMELGRVACGRPMLLALYTGQSIQNRVMREAMRLALAGKLDADQIAELLVQTRKHHLPGPRIFVDIERVIGLDAIDRFFDKRTDEDRKSTAKQLSITDLNKSEAAEVFDTAMDRAVKVVQARLFDAIEDGKPFADDWPLLEIPAGKTDPEGLLRALVPPVSQVLISEREHRCLRAGLIAVLLLERHKLERGGYPASVAELVLPADQTWPSDPLSPDRTRPLTYKRLETGSSPYMLYSIGADGDDNGGHAAAQRPQNALIAQDRWAGCDYIIEAQRP